jgi:hypothetical protein
VQTIIAADRDIDRESRLDDALAKVGNRLPVILYE